MYKNSQFNSVYKYSTMDVGIFYYIEVIQLKNFHPKFLLEYAIIIMNIPCWNNAYHRHCFKIGIGTIGNGNIPVQGSVLKWYVSMHKRVL
jgi:hypothetical protein